jgi:Uma2 family endonuclease
MQILAGSLPLEELVEIRTVLLPERPMTFDEFLDTFGPKDEVELVNGVPQRRTPADLDEALLFSFLMQLLGAYARDGAVGLVLGPRTAVQIGQHGALLPDLLFVRSENVPRMEQCGLRFAPDLVIEIVSPGDRASELLVAESDYRSIGVREIVFVDARRARIKLVRRTVETHADGASASDDYVAETLTVLTDTLRLNSLGVSVPLSWLLTDNRPSVRDVLLRWTSAQP